MMIKKLTCNQLMLLCSLYRGTHAEELRIGTHDKDLHHLHQLGYVDPEDNAITPLGNARVQAACGGL